MLATMHPQTARGERHWACRRASAAPVRVTNIPRRTGPRLRVSCTCAHGRVQRPTIVPVSDGPLATRRRHTSGPPACAPSAERRWHSTSNEAGGRPGRPWAGSVPHAPSSNLKRQPPAHPDAGISMMRPYCQWQFPAPTLGEAAAQRPQRAGASATGASVGRIGGTALGGSGLDARGCATGSACAGPPLSPRNPSVPTRTGASAGPTLRGGLYFRAVKPAPPTR